MLFSIMCLPMVVVEKMITYGRDFDLNNVMKFYILKCV